MREVEEKNRNQHQNAAAHGVYEEFYSSINPSGPSPYADEKIHGDQHHFPEHIKKEKSNAQNTPSIPTSRNSRDIIYPLTCLVTAVQVERIARGQKSGQENEKQADAVDPHMITDAKIPDPRNEFHKLHVPGIGIKVKIQGNRKNKGRPLPSERRPTYQIMVFILQKQINKIPTSGKKVMKDKMGKCGAFIIFEILS